MGGWRGGLELQEATGRAETAACEPGLGVGVGRGVWTTARAQQRPGWTQRLTAQTGLTLGGVSFPPPVQSILGAFHWTGLSSMLPAGEMSLVYCLICLFICLLKVWGPTFCMRIYSPLNGPKLGP